METYILENSLHEGNGNFSLLYEVILRILNFKASMLLPGCGSGLEAVDTAVSEIAD